MFKSLKSFILGASILVSIGFFGGAYLIVSNVLVASIKENALQVSNTIAQLTFNSMFQVMNKGWKRAQLEEFITATHAAVWDSGTAIDVYRGETVTELFGQIEQRKMDAPVVQALRDGKPFTQVKEDSVRYLFPLRAEERCLRCHENAKEGNVLGVIDVYQNLTPVIDKAKGEFFWSLVFLAPVPMLMALLVVLLLNRKIGQSITVLEDSIEQVNRVSDLKHLELGQANLGFSELDSIFQRIGQLVLKLRAVAVDKDLLEFEIKLLEKFVITSEVVKDWREYVGRLLIEINQVIDAYMLFSIFKVDEEMFDLEIFWRQAPTERTREMMEKSIRDTFQHHPNFVAATAVHVNHNIVGEGGSPIELEERDIELQVKSLLVETPKIGGIVGIGVHAEIARDETRLLVMDSVLSTLLNVVGSVKAIHKYTRDLEYYATRDPLTDLYNQRVFWELLGYEIGRAQRHNYQFCLLVLDLDNFKTINDSHGHTFGDRYLGEFALVAKKALRAGDMLARYGGDEFVVILPEAGPEQGHMVASRIIEYTQAMELSAPDGSSVRGTVSVGLSVYPDHATEVKDLFLFADNMMYKAKGEGKGRLSVATEEDVVEVFRAIGEKSMIILNAVEERKIIPFFQPILNVQENRVDALEVLSRIQLDDRIMGADEFVEIAEKMGVIHKLDYIVIEKALQQVQEVGYTGYVFLNLSPRALVLGEFTREVRRIVANCHMDPTRIVFEITERDTVKNMSLLEKFVNDLKMEGFNLAIDDFGSGFSSFHYLKRFPIDFLKIEGDFIANMIHDDKDRAFVRSISRLAQELGIRSVAEYVESEEVLESVKACGIDFAQGYHIGRPSIDISAAMRGTGKPLDGGAKT